MLYFAAAAAAAGVREDAFDLPAGATAGDALAAARARRSGLTDAVAGSLSLAVNHAYAGAGEALADGDEVALIPPVSGG